MLWSSIIVIALLLAVIIAGLIPPGRSLFFGQIAGNGLAFAAAIMLLARIVAEGPAIFGHEYLYIDTLGAFNIALITFVGLTASIYSVGYMSHELTEKIITVRQLRQYFILFQLFLLSMLGACMVNSLGLLWVGIELTTVISALLVGFYHQATSIEAAWKYLIIGSVGISFALIGIILVYLSGIDLFGHNEMALNWTFLMEIAPGLNKKWILTGFIFILIGVGTKAGLAPMHFWLPDAHSQAPSPVSAVLSGVLLNTSLYGILRVYTIANTTLGGAAAGYLIFFGLLSVAIAVPFIMVQQDIKRMLAYSSVEHIGIITLGIGIGGSLGLYGAALHMFNHAVVKPLLFFAAGNIIQKYDTRDMSQIKGLVQTLPVTGPVFLLGSLAIVGLPPFNIFISELTIMVAGFREQKFIVTVLFILLLVLIFAGMLQHIMKMVFTREATPLARGEISPYCVASYALPVLLMFIGGFYVPELLDNALGQIIAILQGGGQ